MTAHLSRPFSAPSLDALTAEDREELNSFYDDMRAASAEVYDAEAHAETRDDGAIYHGRLSRDDSAEQWFSPGHMASAQVIPMACEQIVPPVVIVEESASLPPWMLRALSVEGKPGESGGDITDALMMKMHDCAGRA